MNPSHEGASPDDKAALPPAWQRFLAKKTQAITQAGLWRTIDAIDDAPGPAVKMAGQELLLFCSNNYLGLASDPRLATAASAAAQRYGVGSGASRLLSGSGPLHGELERRLARLKGCEDCVLFGSGYLANVGTLAALLEPGDTVLSDRLNHASIIDGCRLSGAKIEIYPHRDTDAVERILRTAQGRVLIVTDSIFSMDGDLAPLPQLCALAKAHGALLMVDEAHATGVLGAGAIAHCGLSGEVPVVMGTCSKALGSLGGFIAGSRLLCNYLRQRARTFFFDTALPPPVLAATLTAVDIIEQEPQHGLRVLALAQRVYQRLAELGFSVLPPSGAIVPVLFGPSAAAMDVAAALRSRGVLAMAVRPPTVPEGTARIRLCLMASHTDEHIERLLASFAALPPSLRRAADCQGMRQVAPNACV